MGPIPALVGIGSLLICLVCEAQGPAREGKRHSMYLKRREFSKLALAAAAAPLGELFAAKPNSIFNGVVIGTITYSFRSEAPAASEAEPLLKMVVDSGISHIELMPPAA